MALFRPLWRSSCTARSPHGGLGRTRRDDAAARACCGRDGAARTAAQAKLDELHATPGCSSVGSQSTSRSAPWCISTRHRGLFSHAARQALGFGRS